tara:strand:+ start:1432 stop:1728 length:297 start_codon:yes stop_codon:yes gene_type:complete
MTLVRIILKLIARCLLREIRDELAKLWGSSERVSIKVSTRFLRVKIRMAIKKQQRVGRMQQNDQKLRTKYRLEVLNYKHKSLSKKRKPSKKKWKQTKG